MTDRPNVVWIFGDQHRAQALGCMGDANAYAQYRCARSRWRDLLSRRFRLSALPSLPRIAAVGTLSASRCSGSSDAASTGVINGGTAFRAAGYHTAYFGKWHLDGYQERDGRAVFHHVPRPRRGGFDTWLGYENNNAQYDTWLHGHTGEEEVEEHRLERYETDALTDLLLRHVEERAADGAPFCRAQRAATA